MLFRNADDVKDCVVYLETLGVRVTEKIYLSRSEPPYRVIEPKEWECGCSRYDGSTISSNSFTPCKTHERALLWEKTPGGRAWAR